MAQIIPEPQAESASRRLPPVILHPFSDQSGGSDRFVEGSRAGLMLSGLLPSDGVAGDELEARVLRSRYLEIRMLYFLGKDLARWMEQCTDSVRRALGPHAADIRSQSFAHLLTRQTPPAVADKLRAWGVHDFKSIFARALGLHSAFAQPPELAALNRDFVLNYHRFADFLFVCFQQLKPFAVLPAAEYEFELYGSGEYARMLEEQWGASDRGTG
jgi:hypothetical protein